MEHKIQFEIEILKIIRRGSRSPHKAELVHFTRCFAEGGKEMHRELLRMCTTVVLLINSLVQCRCRCGFLNLTNFHL